MLRPRPPRLPREQPTAPRTDTIDRLKTEVGAYSKTVERHDEAIEKWLRPIATELPGQLQTLELSISQLDTTVKAATEAMRVFAEETRRTIREHDERLNAVEERGQEHQVRWQMLDIENLPPRVKALEQRQATEDTTQRINTALVAQQRKWISFALRHGWKAICALQAAALAYLGLK